MAALAIFVRLHEGRYHGRGEWPPAPWRLFQALVAGAGLSGALTPEERDALKRLERLPAPIIAAPRSRRIGRGVRFYMPNNDSDRIRGEPSKFAAIRTAVKIVQPWLFDETVAFVYVWRFDESSEFQQASAILASLADRLYQFGRGIDMAWAWTEALEESEIEKLLAEHPGEIFRPSEKGKGVQLSVPCPGSLESLERRYRAFGERFSYHRAGRTARVVFRQPPKAQFRLVAYNSPPSWHLFELCHPAAEGERVPWPLEKVYRLVVELRDAAIQRLKRAVPSRAADIDRVLLGRKPDGSNDYPPEQRVRIVPLPSIGHPHADRAIRRVLVVIPPGCLLRPEDIQWAFSGLEIFDPKTVEAVATLVPSHAENFVRHYGIAQPRGYRVWRTVTPAVLPESARRRRIEPARWSEEAKSAEERLLEQRRAGAAVCHALRHAGVRCGINGIRVQKEPFEGKGRRVEEFAEGTRFDKHRLWHIAVELREPVEGPLLIGDGRFLGLGLMAPCE
ncbi:MAG: type I-U CRISPR-associated protein Csb2 [Bryobacterales bacterium]|nr:type I-U CRISPR-associated protein Csb2 [Bryobacterales bacterium]